MLPSSKTSKVLCLKMVLGLGRPQGGLSIRKVQGWPHPDSSCWSQPSFVLSFQSSLPPKLDFMPSQTSARGLWRGLESSLFVCCFLIAGPHERPRKFGMGRGASGGGLGSS